MRLALLFALFLGCSAPKAPRPPACPPLPAPVTIPIPEPKPGELHELLDLADEASLWAPAPEDEAARAYRTAIAARLGDVSPRALLERQQAVFSASERPREAANIAPVLEGRAGSFGEPSCIERRLFARQAARYPMVSHPTEFGAFLLRGNGRAHLYFSSMDMVGQKIRHEVIARVEDDLAHGFVLVAHLHNHPFLLDRVPGDRMWTTADTVKDVAGGLAPSLADADLWINDAKDFGLREGWITNGFSSNHVPAEAFRHFVVHEAR